MESDEVSARLLRQVRGHQLAALIHLAVRWDLADRVAQGRGVDELAGELQVDAQALARLVRALAAFGIFEIDPALQHVSQTAASRLLMKDAPRSLHAAASFWGLSACWSSWQELEYSVRTGECTFEHRHRQPLFDHPILDRSRTASHPQSRLPIIERLLDAQAGPNDYLSDVEMPVPHKSAERTADDYRTLVRRAGFHVECVIGTASPFSVSECLPL